MRSASWIAAVMLAAARDAAACDDAISAEMVAVHQATSPAHDGQLHVDAAMSGPMMGWGDCHGVRHRIGLVTYERPDLGDRDGAVLRLGLYAIEWHAARWSAYAGLHGATRWSYDWRFATPVVGARAWPSPQLRVTAEVASGGLYAAAANGAPRSATRDLDVTLTAAWPARAATRGELRLEARDYVLPGSAAMPRVDDVTLTAGVGLSLASHFERGDGALIRGVPGLLGLALRRADDRTELLVVADFAIGLTAD